jgi:hypothetical protein
MRVSTVLTGLVAVVALSLAPAAAAETVMEKLLRVAGLTAGPAPARAAADAAPGNIWVAPTDKGSSRALTTDGGYSSPIFSPDGRLYALKGGAVVRLPQEMGGGVAVHKVPGVRKLVGFDARNPDELVVLLDATGAASPLGVLSLASGRVAPLPYDDTSEEQRHMLARIRSDERHYGTTGVYLTTQSRPGKTRPLRWTDVYIRSASAAGRNISRCDGVSCAQPTVSPDGRSVAFIKAGK